MKKIIRITVCAVLLAALCLSLSACQQLDDLKNKTGIYTDETKEEISLRGKTYVKFAEQAMESFHKDAYPITDAWGIYITDADVPVLLSQSEGESIRYNTDAEGEPIILAVTDSTPYNYRYIYYCREDKLNEVKAKMGTSTLDHLYTDHSYWSNAQDSYVYGKKLLSQEQYDVIMKTIDRPYDSEKDLAETADIYFYNWKGLYYTDAEMLFKNDIEIELVESETGAYYVIRRYYEDDAMVNSDNYWKRISKEDMSVLEPLFIEAVEEPEAF